MHMSHPIQPEIRTQILAAVKSGTSVVDAASEHGVPASTIRKWLKKLSGTSSPSTSEVQRLKKRIQFLESVVLDLVLEQKAQTYKG